MEYLAHSERVPIDRRQSGLSAEPVSANQWGSLEELAGRSEFRKWLTLVWQGQLAELRPGRRLCGVLIAD